MKKFLMLVTILSSLFGSVALAQEQHEGDPQQKKCIPFNEVSKALTKEGYSPVFLGMDANKVILTIVRSKQGEWMLIGFSAGLDKKENKTTIACLIAEGNDGVILQENTINIEPNKEGM